MTPTEAADFLRSYNKWRRGNLAGLKMPSPREIGEAIDAAIDMIDRLEAAESERDELRAKLERVEKQRDGLIGTMRVLAARPVVDEGRNNWEAIVWESICFAEEAIARTTGDQP